MLHTYFVDRYRTLDQRNKAGLSLSLMGLLAWAGALLIIHLFGIIFNDPPNVKDSQVITVPLVLLLISVILNFFELNKRWNLNLNRLTSILTNLHGIWGLYVCMQINDAYNGYIILFLFSFGLLFIKNSFGFLATAVFALSHLAMAIALLFALGVRIGADEYIFFIFFILYGASSAFVNELGRRRNLHLKSVISQRKHGYEQLEKILYPHQIDLIAAGAMVESTLPSRQGYGCCVTLEVVNSSQIKHELAQEFFREIFRLLSLRLRESYDGPHQSALGFRINELNNKFVCTVGFPFHCPGQARPSRISLQLAKDLIQIFCQNIQKMDYFRPIDCTVIVTAGELEGFFTRGFPIEYRVHGDPLIRAEQLSGMVREAREAGSLQGSSIVIQERVYNSLQTQERQNFSVLQVGAHQPAEPLYVLNSDLHGRPAGAILSP